MTEKERKIVSEIADIAQALSSNSKEALLRFGNDLKLIEKVNADATGR